MATQEERDTDTALHEQEMDMDRPPSEAVREDLEQLARDLGYDPEEVLPPYRPA